MKGGLLQDHQGDSFQLDPAVPADVLVGVLDLKNGMAVHAKAGNRSEYRPVEFAGQRSGDALAIMTHFENLGVKRFYIADLDALTGRDVQEPLIRQCLSSGSQDREFWIDVGWTGHPSSTDALSLARILEAHPASNLVLATESMESVDAVRIATERFGHNRLAMSLDFRSGSLAIDGSANAPANLSAWLETAQQFGVSRFIVLDVSCVGTGKASLSLQLCARVLSAMGEAGLKDPKIISGGGVSQAADVQKFLEQKCDGVLVASALLPERTG